MSNSMTTMTMIKGRQHFSYSILNAAVKPQYSIIIMPSSNQLSVFNLIKKKQAFPSLTTSSQAKSSNSNNNKRYTRDFAICSSLEPSGLPPSSGPPSNILSWILGIAIATVVPFVSYKWGPTLKNKLVTALQTTEDVAEAVEKIAGQVEKAAEEISNHLPTGGKLREVVDAIGKVADEVEKDAEAVDNFIDKVQEEEERAESVVEAIKDELEKPQDESNGQDSKHQNLGK